MYLCSSEQEDKSSFSPYVSLVSSPNLEMAAGIRTAEIPGPTCYESHLWDSFLYGAADADFAGPAVTLRCPDIL